MKLKMIPETFPKRQINCVLINLFAWVLLFLLFGTLPELSLKLNEKYMFH